jgi:hypothetical protein
MNYSNDKVDSDVPIKNMAEIEPLNHKIEDKTNKKTTHDNQNQIEEANVIIKEHGNDESFTGEIPNENADITQKMDDLKIEATPHLMKGKSHIVQTQKLIDDKD